MSLPTHRMSSNPEGRGLLAQRLDQLENTMVPHALLAGGTLVTNSKQRISPRHELSIGLNHTVRERYGRADPQDSRRKLEPFPRVSHSEEVDTEVHRHRTT